MSSDPYAELGAYLTGSEALAMAALLDAGERTKRALSEVSPARRERAAALLDAAGLGHQQRELSVCVLRAVAGSKSVHRELVPVWTMPGDEADSGHLTGAFHQYVTGARQSVTCATYNFSAKSQMWLALLAASETPGVTVTVYVDSGKAEVGAVKAQMPSAVVYGSAKLASGVKIVSHAKFVVIDHELLLLTSANFSFNAENVNVEFGLLIRDSGLAMSVETTMRSKHGSLYTLV